MSNSYKISGSGEVVILAVIPLKGKKEVPGNEIIIIIQGSKNIKKKSLFFPLIDNLSNIPLFVYVIN